MLAGPCRPREHLHGSNIKDHAAKVVQVSKSAWEEVGRVVEVLEWWLGGLHIPRNLGMIASPDLSRWETVPRVSPLHGLYN